jgi:predicted metalloprotease
MLSFENNETWTKIFSENGLQYEKPKIVLFENVTQSGCGTAQSSMGPFIVLQTKPFIWI